MPDTEYFPFCFRLDKAVRRSSVIEVRTLMEQYHETFNAKKEEKSIHLSYLHAVSKDNIEIVQIFHEFGLVYGMTELLKYYLGRQTPLTIALESASPNVLSYLISEIDGGTNEDTFRKVKSPLHTLIRNGFSVTEKHVACCKELLKCPGFPKDTMVHDQTALMVASFNGLKEWIDMLCKAGCQINIRTYHGYDAAFFSLCSSSYRMDDRNAAECLHVLIQNGYDMTNRRIITWVINTGNLLALSLIADVNLDLDTDIPEFNEEMYPGFENPLTLALKQHKTEIALFLIKAGCKHHFLAAISCLSELCKLPKDLYNEKHECDLDVTFKMYIKEIRTLKDLSRIQIRRSLGLFPRQNILELGLPKSLSEYVAGDDFLTIKS